MDFKFQEGEVILVDKPLTWTSFDVVNKVRFLIRNNYDIKKIKVGHAGTLDPLATGLLILCSGKKTKTIEGIQAEQKTYTGIIYLGATTPSFDLETEIDKTFDIGHVTEKDIFETAKTFIGESEQTPPVFSAKKINGKRAYESARAGEEVKMRKSLVTIHSFEVTKIDGNDIHFEISCSKGTYIRSIAFDFGTRLNAGAYLKSLRRTKSGNFDVKDAWNLEKLQEAIVEHAASIKA